MSATLGHRIGDVRSQTYNSWRAMKERCICTTNKRYPLYGGRGITVCERWLKFPNFLFDMGERPLGTTIDRIDNKQGYFPGNCRWSTPKQQRNNRTDSKIFEHAGKRLNTCEWSKELGLTHKIVAQRLSRG